MDDDEITYDVTAMTGDIRDLTDDELRAKLRSEGIAEHGIESNLAVARLSGELVSVCQVAADSGLPANLILLGMCQALVTVSFHRDMSEQEAEKVLEMIPLGRAAYKQVMSGRRVDPSDPGGDFKVN